MWLSAVFQIISAMHGPAVYVISIILFVLAGLLLFGAGTAWLRIARRESSKNEHPGTELRAAAGLTAAALDLLGAALLWAAALAVLLRI